MGRSDVGGDRGADRPLSLLSPRSGTRVAAAEPPRPGMGHNWAVATTLPEGTITLLFTDIEGSTRLLEEFGDGYGEVLEEHRRLLRDSLTRHNGVESPSATRVS